MCLARNTDDFNSSRSDHDTQKGHSQCGFLRHPARPRGRDSHDLRTAKSNELTPVGAESGFLWLPPFIRLFLCCTAPVHADIACSTLLAGLTGFWRSGET